MMRVRFELFVSEIGVASAFYTRVMGFDLIREEPGYSSFRRGEVVLAWEPYRSCRRRVGTSRET